MYRILFVCTGNICRSPTAEGIARFMLEKAGLSQSILVDSAGLYHGHAGSPPDGMAQIAAHRRGYDLSRLRARGFTPKDYIAFDLLLGMDAGHVYDMRVEAPPEHRDRVRLFGDMSPRIQGKSVPDPYGRDAEDYGLALDLIEQGCEDLVAALIEKRPDLG